jgi:hypothetical protein
MLIIRRFNCIDATFGIVPLGQWPSGAQVEREYSLNLCTGRPLTESEDTRCCNSTIQIPGDEHIMLETCRGL